jgi:segregation and condensation protein B
MANSSLALAFAIGNDNEEPVKRVPDDARQNLRMVEALLFAAATPLSVEEIAARFPAEADVAAMLEVLKQEYAGRGVNLVQVAGKWAFRTAGDLSFLLSREAVELRRLSRAALETLAIIAYHQPVTRAEVEAIRGVTSGRGTLDVLLETGWIRMRGRRKAPGRPVTYGTTEAFLTHFGLDTLGDLPGVEEMRAAGLLDARVPVDLSIPEPNASQDLAPDEDPLEPGDTDLTED